MPEAAESAPRGRRDGLRRPGEALDPERRRMLEAREGLDPWYRWGPYLAERQWGTVREDYSPGGEAWTSFPHEQARSRAYRWGEDGLLGMCDDSGSLCFALALWNGQDPILKERLFGLTGPEGNHSEDVKEYYFYLDSTPTHSLFKAMYRYPQRAYPYSQLVEEARRRGRGDPEFELIDTRVFAENRFFDVTVEYVKAEAEEIFIRIEVANRGPDPAPIHLLPQLWFRNTWSWGRDETRPLVRVGNGPPAGTRLIHAHSAALGDRWLACDGEPEILVTENETNAERLWGMPLSQPHVKDAFHRAVVDGDESAVNPMLIGTKAAAHYSWDVPAGGTVEVYLRLSPDRHSAPFADVASVFAERRGEADTFYAPFARDLSPDAAAVQRQAFAGLLWSKQWFYYDVEQWLSGDPAGPPPPEGRSRGRNAEWRHLNNADVISMPDKWEYPWYAAWDLAFHCIPLAQIDPEFAKGQLILLLREWYMHPNGQLPAYEWAFSDVNPPVHAWAVWRVYKIEKRVTGHEDREFLERAFHKLLLNFTWWVNRKDREGNNLFQGGFLGLDNIGVFDRSAPLPTGGFIEQSDGTAWMGMFSLNMLTIALELARTNRAYEDVATKFFEHFLYIAGALNGVGVDHTTLWNEEDEFFYDVLHLPSGEQTALKVRSLVGLIPLLAVETIEAEILEALPGFRGRLEWFLENRPDLAALVSHWEEPGEGRRRLLALVRGHRMKRLLKRMLDPAEFLSPHGIRSLSRLHLDHPYELPVDGTTHTVRYEPAESTTGLFGGNSNWRGPIWYPINYLLIESLQKFHHYYSDDFLVEHPTGSANRQTLAQIATDLSQRLSSVFLRGTDGSRAVFGENETFQQDPLWRDLIPFYEYFDGDTGKGLGASHQTGWTALVAKLLEQSGEDEHERRR